jgi:transcriptional regulator with XRE-family HTH domain
MITRIREVRRARKMTLMDVAAACEPPTTAQTIGRLETGMRTVSVGWLNRIAKALGVTAGDLVHMPDRADLPVAALLTRDGAVAPHRESVIAPPVPQGDMVSIRVEDGFGDYRRGDAVWCEKVAPENFGTMLNRDVLLPRPAGRFVFGRLIGRDGDRLQVLPLEPGGKQQIVTDPAWAAMAVRLVREL